jgi:23S rRNA pseudouridine955/2504/2580 synthase
MHGVQQIEIGEADASQRLDRWFKRRFPYLTHGRLEKLLRTGQVRVDGKRAKAAHRLEAGQTVRVPPLGADTDRPAPKPDRAPADAHLASALRRAVLYKDDDVLVIDKPAGLAVQGGTGLGTSIDDLLDALTFEAKERPRLVHRLDRDTSGCLVLARSLKAARLLADAFRHRQARKIYWAVTVGVPELDRGRIDAPLAKLGGKGAEKAEIDAEGGRRAITFFRVIERVGDEAAWLALMPITGRTHQLRAHCLALGTPILGDGKYAGARAFLAKDSLPRQLHLHARSIRLPLPGKRMIAVEAPLPDHMKKTWRFFGFAAKPEGDPFADLEE